MQKIQPINIDISDFYTSGLGSANHELLMQVIQDKDKLLFLQKLERLKMAFVLLATHASVSQQKIVDSSHHLLELFFDFATSKISKQEFQNQLSITLLKILEFLDTELALGSISTDNLRIIKSASSKLVLLAQNLKEFSAQPKQSLKADDFILSLEKELQTQTHLSVKDKIKDTETKDIKDIKDNQKRDKGHNADKGQNKRHRPVSIATNAKINTRRVQILDLLKMEMQGLTAGEIKSKLNTPWSQKTLQRELQAMIDEGLLIKEGARRWTRYKIRY